MYDMDIRSIAVLNPLCSSAGIQAAVGGHRVPGQRLGLAEYFLEQFTGKWRLSHRYTWGRSEMQETSEYGSGSSPLPPPPPRKISCFNIT